MKATFSKQLILVAHVSTSYKFFPLVLAPLIAFFCTTYFYTPFRDESQCSGPALGTSAAAQPPISGHPASQVSFSWQEYSKVPVGDCSPKADPYLAHVLPPRAWGQRGCSVQAAIQVALQVTGLGSVSPKAAHSFAKVQLPFNKHLLRTGLFLRFFKWSKTVSISHIYRDSFLKLNSLARLKTSKSMALFFFSPKGSPHV